MVIRDLTLRSAASFGSFHLIRLLYDEYMYYLIEHRVAQAKGETPIAVMGEVRPAGRGGAGGTPLSETLTPFLYSLQFANLATSLNPLDPDKGERGATLLRARVRGGGQGDRVGKPHAPR